MMSDRLMCDYQVVSEVDGFQIIKHDDKYGVLDADENLYIAMRYHEIKRRPTGFLCRLGNRWQEIKDK